jgi:hypothetical protein
MTRLTRHGIKMFGDFRRAIMFESFCSAPRLAGYSFYKPAIVLVPRQQAPDYFELEISHSFDQYSVIMLRSDCYVSMSVYCGDILKTSI